MSEPHAARLKALLGELETTQRRVAKLLLEVLADVSREGRGDSPTPDFMAVEELASSVGRTQADLLAVLKAGHTHERLPWPFNLHDERRSVDKLLMAIEDLVNPFGSEAKP